MSLQFITGASGSGKSTYIYNEILKKALSSPDDNFFILVPDQFSQEATRILIECGGGGILNIDVLSFRRLAYRALEEFPALSRTILEDEGKMMLLRKVIIEKKGELKYFKKGINSPGFLDEFKSFISELMQYGIDDDALALLADILDKDSILSLKLHDLRILYDGLKKKMGETYRAAEELIPQLSALVGSLSFIRGGSVCLDGFTGFTPIQYGLINELLKYTKTVYVTVTIDRLSKLYGSNDRASVFSLSTDTIKHLTQCALHMGVDIEDEVFTGYGDEKTSYRLSASDEISFLEEHIFSYDGKKYTNDIHDIHLIECRYDRDEASYVARQIKRLHTEYGIAFSEMAVVASDIDVYDPHLVREFDKLDIPCFTDHKKSLGVNPLADYILSLLCMIRQGLDHESVFKFLRCGLSPLSMDETDILENYVIASGRRGIRSYKNTWRYDVCPERMPLPKVNEAREVFTDAIEGVVSSLSKGKKTIREFSEILINHLEDANIYYRLEDLKNKYIDSGDDLLATEYGRIYEALIKIFDEMVALLGDEKVSLSTYTDILKTGISEGVMGFVPPTGDQVMIADVQRSRLSDIKVLFFIGVGDHAFPKGVGSPGVLNDRERNRIESEGGIKLAPSARALALTEQYYIYLLLTKPEKKLYVTYPLMGSSGETRRPAYIIDQLISLYPKLKTDTDNTAKPQDILYTEDKSDVDISADLALSLYGNTIHASVTRFELFAGCPYAYFARYGLRLDERIEYDINTIDQGVVFHSALEHFSHVLEKEGISFLDMSENEVRELAAQCMDYVLKDYEGEKFGQSESTMYMAKRLKSVMSTSAWCIWKQMIAGDFTQAGAEINFPDGDDIPYIPLSLGRSLVINGKIDRLDKSGNYIRVVDYKRSSKNFTPAEVYHGLKLQLVTYMSEALRSHRDAIPSAMLYFDMDEPVIDRAGDDMSDEEIELERLKKMKMSGYVNSDPYIYRLNDHALSEPYAKSYVVPVEIKKDGTPTSASKLLTNKQFDMLMKRANERMRNFSERIYAGEICARPTRYDEKQMCEYCEYSSLCAVEKKSRLKAAIEYKKMTDDEVWEALTDGE